MHVSSILCLATAGLATSLGILPHDFLISEQPMVSPVVAIANTDQDIQAKLRGNLAQVINDTADDELIPISIIMKTQADQQLLTEAQQLLDKQDRRQRVVEILKSTAEQSQARLIDALRVGQADESVDDRINALWLHNVVGTAATPAMIRQLAMRHDVAWINHDRPINDIVLPVEPARPIDQPGTLDQGALPLGPSIECGVQQMRAPQVWNDLNITGRNVVVGVIDTGACITHPDLANQIWTNTAEVPGNNIDDDNNGYIDDVHGWSFDGNGSDDDISDGNSHGTHVSGTVLGDGSNGETTGMAPDALLMTLKFWNDFSGELSVWNSMEYGVENGADILTASLGWPNWTDPDRTTWRMLCENAIAAGVVVVYAAGNEGTFSDPIHNVRTPGDVPMVITVGATDCNDDIADFSSRGPVSWENVSPWFDHPYPPGLIKPTISAPGVDTLSTSNDCSGYSFKSGTSMATPHVAGAIALMLEANPTLDHAAVKQILMDTAVDLGSPGMDIEFGAGRVDAYAAVQAALQGNSDTAGLVNATVPFGSYVSGNLASLEESDDVYYVAQSAFGFLSSEPNRLDLRVNLETTNITANTLAITFETGLNNPGGSGSLALRNWNTSAFDVVSNYAVGNTDIVHTAQGIAAGDYINSNGRIRILSKQVVIATFSLSGFTARYDHIEVVVE